MAQNNDVIDLTNAAPPPPGGPDEYVIGGRLTATGDLELDMQVGGHGAISIPLPGISDDFVVSGLIDPTTHILTLARKDGGTIDIDMNLVANSSVGHGGAEWLAGLQYEFGDIVSVLEAGVPEVYVALVSSVGVVPTGNIAKWVPISAGGGVVVPPPVPERGGILWDATTSYQTGDVVSEGGTVYIAASPTTGQHPLTNPSVWRTVSGAAEIGGLVWNGAATYPIGAVATKGGDIFISQTITTGQDPLITPSAWILYESAEFGGRIFNPAHIYSVGDIVTANPGQKQFVCVVAGTTGAWNASNWRDITERGGILWDNTTNYQLRDVVSIPSTDKLYIAMKANVGSSPLLALDWFELNSMRYVAGSFTPTAGNEYPDVTTGGPGPGGVHESGAVWYTGVLPPGGYTIAAGPLAGVNVVTLDKYVWYEKDSSGNDIWLWEPFPRMAAERGGKSFNSAFDYKVGTIVTEGEDMFMAIAAVPPNSGLPSTDPASWRKLDIDMNINILFDPTLDYIHGDIVVNGDHLFLAPVAGIPAGPWDATKWTPVNVDEFGGKAFDAANAYEIGDVITLNGIIYICATANTGSDPLTSADWVEFVSGGGSGGGAWDVSITYDIGDIVSQGGDTYVAIAQSTGSDPATVGNTDWKQTNSTGGGIEIGGRLWDATVEYLLGDVVVDAITTKAYRATSITTTIGNAPNGTPGEWMIIGLPAEDEGLGHKGESLSTGGVNDDTKWSPTLTTPSKLYADLIIDDDPDINHSLIGVFDTNGFTLTVPAGNTLTII